MKYDPHKNPLQLQEIILKDKTKVTVAWKKKGKCKKCGKKIWCAIRHKDKKHIHIELTGLAEWKEHECHPLKKK